MKRYILVAGVDYEFRNIDFSIFCRDRMRRLIALNQPREELKFQIFDFARGEIVTYKVAYSAGRKTENEPITTTYRGISRSNYERVRLDNGTFENQFRRGQYGVLSIVHVYEAVHRVSIDSPGTLVELSFFSHGGMGGPILVNSYDRRPSNDPSLPFRLPDDMDPRTQLDFIAPNMDANALSAFKRAFHSDGYVWLWGCANPRVIRQILIKVLENTAYGGIGPRDPEVQFRFTYLTNEEFDWLFRFLGPKLLFFPRRNRRNIEIRFKYLTYVFCMLTLNTYAFHIAKAADVRTYAPVLGTSSDYDQAGALPLMHVHPRQKRFNFYKKYLGFGFDPERRNYGEYRPDFTCPDPFR